MRVHGDKIIVRRMNIIPQNDYSKYTNDLREDFCHICGYCGKSEVVTKNAFEPDHFIPINMDSEKKNEYNNLVYSCFECNRKKSGKWPSKDPSVQFLDGKGFVDPASGEYDLHLERAADGMIYGKTVAGEYMAREGFAFHLRPIREIWKAMQLIEKKEALRKKIPVVSEEEQRKYIELDMLLEKIQRYLFEKKE